jgi:hypothetical protein
MNSPSDTWPAADRPHKRSPMPNPQPDPLFTASGLAAGFWFFLTCGVVILAINLFINLPPTHRPRVVGVVLPLVVVVALGLTQGRRSRGIVQLLWLVTGVALAFLAWWFVPTSEGLSYWGATRRVAKLEAVSPGAVAEFLQEYAASRDAVAQFPELKSRLETVRDKWATDTIKAGVAEAQALLPGNPSGASRYLQKLHHELTELGHFAIPLQGSLRDGRYRALTTRLEAAAKELKTLEAEKKLPEIDRLAERLTAEWGEEARAIGAEDDLRALFQRCALVTVGAEVAKARDWLRKGDLTEASTHLQKISRDRAKLLELTAVKELVHGTRRRVVQTRLEWARKELVALVAEEKYSGVALLKQRLASEWASEAGIVGAGAELQAFV